MPVDGARSKSPAIRVTTVYATNATMPFTHQGQEPGRFLGLGRLASYYDRSAAQLPQVIGHRSVPPEDVKFTRWRRHDRLQAATTWSFMLPTGQVIAAISLDLHCQPVDTVDVLTDCYYEDVAIDENPLGVTLLSGLSGDGAYELFPERHQLVFIPTDSPRTTGRKVLSKTGVNEDVLQRIIYRADLPYRPEYSSIVYPPELNRRLSAAAGIGPYVSVLAGQQDYVENGAFLSAVQAVGSSARLREIRTDAYDSVRELDVTPTAPLSLRERRQRLEALADKLSRIEVDLSRGVEAPADLDLLVPSLRLNNFHGTLFDCMCLTEQATTVARMISRIERAIAAELTSIESAERRSDDRRRARWAVAVGFISTVAVPVTIILGFFGINAREVDNGTSMFDSRYLPVYLLSGLFVAIAGLLYIGLYVQHRSHDRITESTG